MLNSASNLVAYRLNETPYRLVTASPKRQWMDETDQRFAYRCLPMVIANQAGWNVLNPYAFRAMWIGGDSSERILIESEYDEIPVSPIFGHGILTFHLPWLFRTPEGWNIRVSGPANEPKDGISPLEGIVEADWTTATFTMNWKFTGQGQWVWFDEGEPIAQIAPVRRHDLEMLNPVEVPLSSDPELERRYQIWSNAREDFNNRLSVGEETASAEGWERNYMRGETKDGVKAPDHQTKLHLAPFQAKENLNGL